jgi:hypothetical protein
MNTRDDSILGYLDRFYSLYLNDKLKDPKADAEWSWFLNRLKDNNFRMQQA